MSRLPPKAEPAVDGSSFRDNADIPDVWFVPRNPIRESITHAGSVSLRKYTRDREPWNLLLPSLTPLQGNVATTQAVAIVPPAPPHTPDLAATNTHVLDDNTPEGTFPAPQVHVLWSAQDTLVEEL